MDRIVYFSGEIKFCQCGLPAVKQFKPNVYLCQKHDKPIKTKVLRGKFSGKSKTPFGLYEES